MSEEVQASYSMPTTGGNSLADAKQDHVHSPIETSQHSTTPSPTAIRDGKPLMQMEHGGNNEGAGQSEQHDNDEETKGDNCENLNPENLAVDDDQEGTEEGDFEDMGEEEEEEEEEDDDDELDDDQKVVDASPKGRFKRFKEELGRGAYKIVYKGVDHETGLEVAWNSISLLRLPQSDRIRIRKEIDLIKKLKHDSIIHFIAAWQNKEKQEVVFITEITSGTLRRYIKKNKITKLRVIKGWCQSILSGLMYLHEQPSPIIHRDLKCDNIFINSNSGEIRIGDLGLSTPMNNSYTSSVLGTPEFMAPELYEEHYDCKVDIYAFGMCMLEMITQSLPYSECLCPAQIYKKVTAGQPPLALSRIKDQEVSDFISRCLDADKAHRPSARELLESPFIQNLDDDASKEAVNLGPPIRRPNMNHKRKSFLQANALAQPSIPEVEEEHFSDAEDQAKKKLEAVLAAKKAHEKSIDSAAHTNKGAGDDPNQTLCAGRMESMIQEIHAEEQDDIINSDYLQVQNNSQSHPVTLQSKSGVQSSSLSGVGKGAGQQPDRRESILSVQTQLVEPLPSQQLTNLHLPAPLLLPNSRSVQQTLVSPLLQKTAAGADDVQSNLMRFNTGQTEEVVRFNTGQTDDIRVTAASEHTEDFQAELRNLGIDQTTVGEGCSDQTLTTPKVVNLSPHKDFDYAQDQQPSKPLQVAVEMAMEPQLQDTRKNEAPTLLRQNSDNKADDAQPSTQKRTDQTLLTMTPAGDRLYMQATTLLGPQQNSEGNQSQSSGMTMRKLTDVGGPDCTFSDPKFGQENEDQSQTSHGDQPNIILGVGEPYNVHPFAALGASPIENCADQPTVNMRNRIQSQEAQFGGSDDGGSDRDAYEALYASGDSKEEYSDDAKREMERLDESVQMLNEMDRKKHERMQRAQQSTTEDDAPILEELTAEINNGEYEKQRYLNQISKTKQPRTSLKHEKGPRKHQSMNNFMGNWQNSALSGADQSQHGLPQTSQGQAQGGLPLQPHSGQVRKNTPMLNKRFDEDKVIKKGQDQQMANGATSVQQSQKISQGKSNKQLLVQTGEQQPSQSYQATKTGHQTISIRKGQNLQCQSPHLPQVKRQLSQDLSQMSGLSQKEQYTQDDENSEFDEQRSFSDSDSSDLSEERDFGTASAMPLSKKQHLEKGRTSVSQRQILSQKKETNSHLQQSHLKPSMSSSNLMASNVATNRIDQASQPVGQQSQQTVYHGSSKQQQQTAGASQKASQSQQVSATPSDKRYSKNAGKQQGVQNDRSHQQQQRQSVQTPTGYGESWIFVCSKNEHHQQNSKQTEKSGRKYMASKQDAGQQQSQADYLTSCKECAAKSDPRTQQQPQSKAEERPSREKRRLDKARSSSNLPGTNRGESANRQQTTPKPQKRSEHPNPQKNSISSNAPSASGVADQSNQMSTSPNLQPQEPSRNNNPPASGIVSTWQRASKNTIRMTIQLPTDQKRKSATASFNFNIIQDTANGVANEMVKELSLNPSFKKLIENEIDESVRKFRELEQKKAELEKEKERDKLLRHHFRKLQSHLDTFFLEMSKAGLQNIDEIQRAYEQVHPNGQPSCKRKDGMDVLAKVNKFMKQSNNNQSRQLQKGASEDVYHSYNNLGTANQPAGSLAERTPKANKQTQQQPAAQLQSAQSFQASISGGSSTLQSQQVPLGHQDSHICHN